MLYKKILKIIIIYIDSELIITWALVSLAQMLLW